MLKSGKVRVLCNTIQYRIIWCDQYNAKIWHYSRITIKLKLTCNLCRISEDISFSAASFQHVFKTKMVFVGHARLHQCPFIPPPPPHYHHYPTHLPPGPRVSASRLHLDLLHGLMDQIVSVQVMTPPYITHTSFLFQCQRTSPHYSTPPPTSTQPPYRLHPSFVHVDPHNCFRICSLIALSFLFAQLFKLALCYIVPCATKCTCELTQSRCCRIIKSAGSCRIDVHQRRLTSSGLSYIILQHSCFSFPPFTLWCSFVRHDTLLILFVTKQPPRPNVTAVRVRGGRYFFITSAVRSFLFNTPG